MDIAAKTITLTPIAEDVRAKWLRKDLLRVFGTSDEEQALDKFMASRKDNLDRESARTMMKSYVRFH